MGFVRANEGHENLAVTDFMNGDIPSPRVSYSRYQVSFPCDIDRYHHAKTPR